MANATDYKPPIRYCRNCHKQLPGEVAYCPHCGQKNTDGRVPALHVLRDKLSAVLNLDSRTLRTFGALIIPGKLTEAYFKGRHKCYVSSIRLFLVASVLLIALVGYLVNRGLDGQLDSFTPGEDKKWHHQQSVIQLDTLTAQLLAQRGDTLAPDTRVFLDTLLHRFRGTETTSDSIGFTVQISSNSTPKRISKEDYYNLTPAEIAEKYEVEGFFQQLIFRQQIRFMRSGSSFILYLIGKSTWALLLLMPIFALALMLFYMHHPFYYVEHLLFSMHVHTALFLFLTATVVLQQATGMPVTIIILPGMLLYIILAMRRFYRQSWGKTILKFALLNFVYVSLLSFLMLAMAIVGFLLF